MKKQLLIVDGYNMIGAWKKTRQAFQHNRLEEARDYLLEKLSEYANFEGIEVVCVFDAQYVPGVRTSFKKYNVLVIFTEEDETADSYIERLAGECNDILTQVYVATSDLAEQWVVFSQGAARISARELEKLVSVGKSELKNYTNSLVETKPRANQWTDEQISQLKDLMNNLE
ncbi:NYN domain-containing protein [Streptococcaceae bacterium ESL0687]|nr:NYN domain-containing protein [Streptococcaceae bacterium ESL0687]